MSCICVSIYCVSVWLCACRPASMSVSVSVSVCLQEQAVKMKEILKVLEAMRSEELAAPLTIKGAQKERIAVSAGVVSE